MNIGQIMLYGYVYARCVCSSPFVVGRSWLLTDGAEFRLYLSLVFVLFFIRRIAQLYAHYESSKIPIESSFLKILYLFSLFWDSTLVGWMVVLYKLTHLNKKVLCLTVWSTVWHEKH